MSVNVNGNIISSTGFDSSGNILNTPSIVTSGLVLWLDAGNLSSYNYVAGTGAGYYDCGYGCQYYASNPGCTNCNTQIKDMSGYGNDGTIYSATITYDNTGGNLTFNGTSYVSFNNPLNQSNLTQEWSVSVWVNLTSSSGTQAIIENLNLGLFAMFAGSAPLLYLNSGANDYYLYGSGTFGTGWHHITFRFKNSDGTRTIWRDGVEFSGSGPNSTSTPFGQGATFILGHTLTGSIGPIQIYNRLLTNNEVIQNFNTDRQRYGL